ncbi:sugar ABC transporter substrate-binding protein [Antribacter sp. KLBMP9083]|uniref:Sugar ABC transporter substrate-binding protein n=1 Tax=Antribacter soli TaxID=2910976 RepID=A0AA41QAF2_9MICO|nr:sugar ABC transporter substrate-binding protein [Antribacter soli]MCF4119663.1 sugar ABC transporter substrate-binding protein [Antribacter soli]MCF4123425.1 sugar ABC transporter substrate-binding protein [Antribacter soli]
MMLTRIWRHKAAPAGLAVGALALALTACSSSGDAGGGAGGDVKLTIATVNNPQMQDMEELKSHFEEDNPGITVEFVTMEEGDLRAAVTADVASGAGQYDIVTVGAYEVPQWGAQDWLLDLTESLEGDAAYDVDDILPPLRDALSVDGKQYAVPFYGESSILMYNKAMFAEAGIEISNNPTWQEVAEYAAVLDTDEHAGICLRGKPGWGDLFAPLTTVVQTFGGNWYDENWDAQVNSPEFVEGVEFYVDLLTEHGQADPVSYSFTECLNLLSSGKVAMWYDASVAASILEDPEASEVAGQMGYTHAPVYKTEESGWLWSWNLAIPKTTKNPEAATTFVKWATSKEYHQLVGEELGWTRVPPGARTSTYSIPEYQEAAAAFAPITLEVMESVNPEQPGVDPQPWVGIQYVPIPEFQDVGNQVAQLVADAIAGRTTVQDALDRGQDIAQTAGDLQK